MCSLLVEETEYFEEKEVTKTKQYVYERERESTYFQPTICPQQQQNVSATVCRPESIILSSNAPIVIFTLDPKLRVKSVSINTWTVLHTKSPSYKL